MPTSAHVYHPELHVRLAPGPAPSHSRVLMLVKMPSHTGSVTLLEIPRSFFASNSAGFNLQDALVVAITAKSRKVVGRVSCEKWIQMPAVNAVAAFPLRPASCFLSFMRLTSEDFSLSSIVQRNGSHSLISFFRKAFHWVQCNSKSRFVAGRTELAINLERSLFLFVEIVLPVPTQNQGDVGAGERAVRTYFCC